MSNPGEFPPGGYTPPARGPAIREGSFPPHQTGQARPANPLPGAHDIADPSLGVQTVPTTNSAPDYMSLIHWVKGKLDRGGGY